MIRIEESNMSFEFREEDIFQIENSKLQKSLGNGIKTVEFIVSVKDNELYFIEAKSSSPQPRIDNKEKFDTFVTEIAEKFMHSFNMYLSAIMKRNIYEEIPSKFFNIDESIANFKFILIIKNHEIEWLSPIKDAINKKLLDHTQIWKSNIVLLNETLAKEYNIGLVV